MKYIIIIAALSLLLLGIAGVGTKTVLAWNGDDWDHHCCDPHWGVGDYQPSYFYQQPGSGAYQNGWYAGQQDAIYDHDNNLQYNPVGQCLSCHSDIYWNGFHEEYDKQWNSYQSTVAVNTSPKVWVGSLREIHVSITGDPDDYAVEVASGAWFGSLVWPGAVGFVFGLSVERLLPYSLAIAVISDTWRVERLFIIQPNVTY